MIDSLPCNECHLASIHMREKYLQLLCLLEESFIYKFLPRPAYHQSFPFEVSNHLISLMPMNQYLWSSFLSPDTVDHHTHCLNFSPLCRFSFTTFRNFPVWACNTKSSFWLVPTYCKGTLVTEVQVFSSLTINFPWSHCCGLGKRRPTGVGETKYLHVTSGSAQRWSLTFHLMEELLL